MVSPKWLKITSCKIKATFSNNNSFGGNTGGGDIEEATLELQRTINSGENTVVEEIDEAILGHQWRINKLEEELVRIALLQNKLNQRSIAIKINRGKNK
eukprot:12791082-Ditylum_brightwellii.AAC.2